MSPASSPDVQNPLLAPWSGDFELPPFTQIKAEHFRPAFDRALAEHRAEIDAIAANQAEPSFENTVAALEKSGRQLERVANVFFVLAGANTSDEIAGHRARHGAAARPPQQCDLSQSRALHSRIAGLHRATQRAGPQSREQARVLERYHTRFVRAGAALERPAQERLAAINERLASLGTQFGQNVLADEKSFAMIAGGRRSCRTAGFRPCGRASCSRRARPPRQIRRHPGALIGRAVSAVFVPARPARKGVPGVDQRAAKMAAQPITDADRGDGGAAGRTGKAARLCDLRRLPARRQMAKTPAAARELLDEVWGRARAKAAANATLCRHGRRRGRQLRARAVGLALLHREAPQGAATISMRPRSSRISSSTT